MALAEVPSVTPTELTEETEEIRRLQQELEATREYLHSIIEQQEVTNEDLTSANEEIQASNEELQSTNEELKTAKKEITRQTRQLQLITNAIPDLIAYLNAEEEHLFVNAAYKQWFSVSCADVVGSNLVSVWGEVNYQRFSYYLKLALSGKHLNFDMEFSGEMSERKYLHVELIPDFENGENVSGVILLIKDITGRKTIESIERKRLLDSAHLSRLTAMGEMTSEIAHELNQPLAAISIYSDACRRIVLSNKFDQEQIVTSLKNISDQASRAGEVIKRIREFTRKKDLCLMQISMNDLVQEAMELIGIELLAHDVSLNLKLALDLPLITVDRILVEQVILNLARNAIEAMGAIDTKQRLLEIQTSVTKTGEIEVSVDDSGPGLTAEKIKEIFDPFYTTKPDGMGMGLSISHTIINAHHGRLWAVPNDHGGTLFAFTLPVENEEHINVL